MYLRTPYTARTQSTGTTKTKTPAVQRRTRSHVGIPRFGATGGVGATFISSSFDDDGEVLPCVSKARNARNRDDRRMRRHDQLVVTKNEERPRGAHPRAFA